MIELFYDGQCGMCRRSTAWIRRLDWLGRVRLVEFSTLPEHERPVEFDDLNRGIPVRTTDGRILLGFEGLRHAFLRTPLGWVVGWIFYLPAISHLGRGIYGAIARRRRRDAVCEIGGDREFASDEPRSADA